MKHNFPFVEIPNYMKNRIGKKDPDTRLFRRQGTEEEVSEWFESICEICEGLGVLSPGGVSMYVRVSRPAVHKRLKEGRLTGFFFHQVSDGKLFKDRKKMQDGGLPYCFIPVSECKAWAEELRIRREKHKVDQVEGSK